MSGNREAFRICLIEDNPGDIYLLEKALKRHHIAYELTCYADGEQAIRGFSQNDPIVPDLILLDLKLPRRDGFDVLRDIRSRPWLVGVRVGVLTSSDAEPDRHRVALQGVERYIHKPVGLEEFLDVVGQAVKEMLAR
jgi:CheY-like chemotaxis protein